MLGSQAGSHQAGFGSWVGSDLVLNQNIGSGSGLKSWVGSDLDIFQDQDQDIDLDFDLGQIRI